jgi:hypothetical protein
MIADGTLAKIADKYKVSADKLAKS